LIKNHEKKKQIYQQTNKIFHKPIHEESVDQKNIKGKFNVAIEN